MRQRKFVEQEAIEAWKVASNKSILHPQDSTCFHREFVSGASWQFDQMKVELEAAENQNQINHMAAQNGHRRVQELESRVVSLIEVNEMLKSETNWQSSHIAKLSEDNLKLISEINELKAEIERLNGPQCSACGSCGDEYCCPARGCKYPLIKANEEMKQVADTIAAENEDLAKKNAFYEEALLNACTCSWKGIGWCNQCKAVVRAKSIQNAPDVRDRLIAHLRATLESVREAIRTARVVGWSEPSRKHLAHQTESQITEALAELAKVTVK